MSKLRLQTRKRTSSTPHARAKRTAMRTHAPAPTSTLVHVRDNPLQPRGPLYTKLENMNSALQATLNTHSENRERISQPHAMMIHMDACSFGVVVWPRASNGDDLEEMQDAVAERDAQCSCRPLVMYLGAMA